MKKLLITLLVILTLGQFSLAEMKFNQKQLDTMRYACSIGLKMKVKGDHLCFTMAAIALQESGAGMNIKGKVSYGVFQNNVNTVQARLRQQGIRLSKQAIIQKLYDRSYSGKYAKIELEYWLKARKGNVKQALASYNAGWKWQKGNRYAEEVIRKRNYLIKNNHKLKIMR